MAAGQGFPRLVEPRSFVQARKMDGWRMIVIYAATLRRLVEGLGTGARVDENGIGGVDGRDDSDEDDTLGVHRALRVRLSQTRNGAHLQNTVNTS
jgi:hypothetical protein